MTKPKTDRMLRPGSNPLLAVHFLMICMLNAPGARAQQLATDHGVVSQPETQLGEVVVTANKREQKLQDVGLAVSVVSGEMMMAQRVDGVADLVRLIPGLQSAPTPNSTPVYTLRGVGFYETSVAAYPDVSIYLDQAPLPFPVMSGLTAFDLQRVEVLKGPQGTLFGNNATGGAINFVAAKPTTDFQVGADVSFGRFNSTDFVGFVSGPVSHSLQARLAIKVAESGDWQYSQTRNDTLGGRDQAAFRLLLNWQLRDGLNVTFNVNGWRDRSDPQAPQLARATTSADLQAPLGTVGPTGVIGPDFPLLFAPVAPRNARAADWSLNNRPSGGDRLTQISANVDYEIFPGTHLTLISNLIRYRRRNSTEGDGTALNDLDITSDRADARTFTQELRLAGTGFDSRPLRWVLGANYERSIVDESVRLIVPDSSSGAEQGFSADSYNSDQHMSNTAGFANVEFNATSRVTLKGGLRYTQADRSTLSGTYPYPGYVEPFPGSPGLTNLLNIVWANIYAPTFCPGVTYVPIIPGNSVSINPSTCRAGPYNARLDQNNLSWSVGTDFKAVSAVLLYANIAKGYKAGSFPEVSAATTSQYAPVTQESVLDYEVGFKAQWASGRITFNGGAFYYDYRNKQLRGKTVDPLFGLLDRLVNVPKSQVRGAEAEINLRPVSGLDLRLGGTYAKSEVRSYDGTVGSTRVNGLAFPVRASFSGVPLPFAPALQGSATVDYSFPVASFRGFVGATVTAQSQSFGSLGLTSQDVADARIEPYATLDLRSGIKSSNDSWRVTLWGSNVTDKYYWTNALRAYDTVIRYAGQPARYGIGFSWRR